MPAKKGNSKPAKTAKKPKQTNGKKKSKDKVKEFVAVPEKDDYEISDEDLEFFAENKGFTSFLTSLDAKELTRNTVKKPKAPVKKPAVKQQQTGLESSDEESLDNFEEPDSDEELDNFEEPDSDNEQESDVEQELEDMSEEKMSEMLDLSSKKKKAAIKHDSDEEMDYETKPRKIADEWAGRAKSTKLPIKLPGGKIIQAEKEEAEEKDEDEEMEEVENDQEEDHVEEEEEEEEEEVKVSKKQHLINKKEELATIATNLQEDPEEHIGELKTLRSIYRDDNPIVRKLALLTQLAIYKDIIPGYRIRPLTEAEEEQKVSKDVKKLREYEKSLLTNYEQYLKDLTVLTSKKKAEEDPALSLVATKCLCELLVSKTHFNFRLEIMVSLVTRMSTVQWNEGADLCRKALIEVFENDESGKYSLDAVKMITRMVKSKSYIVSENAINLFLHLRLKDEMVPEASKKNDDEVVGKKRKNKDKPFLTKKAKKALKETKEIEKEFREAEAVVSKEEKEKNHSETLKLIFAFYFRILKKQVTSPLLPAVLEGLSMFAHLINVDMFDDLLNALRDVMRSFEDTNAISRTSSGTRKRLLCIITAFELLSGQGEMVTYDLKEFYTEIYNILFKATYHTAIEEKPESQDMTESEMIVKGLELMFLKKRQIPIDRLGAFIKRFALVALNMPTKTVLQCLHLIHKLVQKDHRLDALLQSEDRASNGIYAPLLNDPELCNPFGTSLYELFLYQNHYDPNVRRIAKELQQTSR